MARKISNTQLAHYQNLGMPFELSKDEQAVARQYQKLLDAEAAARSLWDKKDRELRKLVRLAKMGRRARCTVRISETRAIELKNCFRGTEKVFAPAFARKWDVKEVPADSE